MPGHPRRVPPQRECQRPNAADNSRHFASAGGAAVLRSGFEETGREPINVTRRDLAAAGTVTIAAPSWVRSVSALAETGDEAAVKQSVEALREALLKADKTQLERLTSDQVSSGHSDGRVQDKPEFINGIMTRKTTVKLLTFPDLKVSVAGDAAIARHLL
jgi:hypothetical protein